MVAAVVGVLLLVSGYGLRASEPSDDVVDGAHWEPNSDDAPSLDDLGGLLDAAGGMASGDVDAQVAEAVANALGDLGDYTAEHRDEDLTVAATEVLEDYRAQGVELVFADYLGVLEDTWACLVKGDRWVEICIVREDGDDGSSKVETVHFDADRFAEALPPELFEEGAADALSAELDALMDGGGDADAAPADEGVAR